ncbi:hypothetical protein MJ904_20705 [Massilia sp. MB5]|uniref:hypothetical protein n=1 Tax=Massilia sp. MB5 TaxID=2919578 RepID=UPI001F106FEB|nr:hypothetical protein [Massilia sp. MB5]UMR29460.1 hypothetical protein MJ904_20705 [Massilia sp. MB5]
MTQNEIIQLISNNHQRISTAISCGAAWEIWFQVEMAILMRNAGKQAVREIPYPNGSQQRLDLSVQENFPNGTFGRYAMEIKVESATNTGNNLFMQGIRDDVNKLQAFAFPVLPGQAVPVEERRWVIGIGYSSPAKQALQAYANNRPNTTYYQNNIPFGVLVTPV